LDEEISKHHLPKVKNLGITEEVLAEAMEDVLEGKDDEPLHDQRMPHKQERVVAAYAVPHSEGHQLIFETRDGELWQVSDVGLAWTLQEEVSDEWEKIDQLNAHLPATIDPRPPTDGPYNYSFELSENTVFRVQEKEESRGWTLSDESSEST